MAQNHTLDHHSRRIFLRATGLAAGGLIAGPAFLTACSQPVGEGGAAPTKRLRIATSKAVTELRVTGGGGSESQNAALHIFDQLTTLDEKLTPQPWLAESFEQITPTRWRFQLRSGVKFSNGEPFDSAAVVFSITAIATAVPAYAYKDQWGQAWPPTATAEGPSTVVIETPSPQPIMPRLLSRLSMVPPKAGAEPGFGDKPVGTGAYTVASWNKGTSLLLQANPGYWGGAPSVQEIEWTSIPDASARLVALQGGDVDLAWDVPFDRVADLNTDGRHKVFEVGSLGLGFLTFNFRKTGSPIADVRVRKAMTYAIDRNGIVASLMSGKGELNMGPAPSAAVGAVDAGGYPTRDLIQARALLAEAGYPNGVSLKLMYGPGQFQNDANVCLAVIAQLKEAGIKVDFEQVEAAAISSRLKTDTWDLLANGVPGSFSGEAGYHYYQLKAQQGFNSKATEDLLQQADAAGKDGAARVSKIQEAMRAMWKEVPYLWSVGTTRTFGMDKTLGGYQYVPVNWLILRRASFTKA